MSGLRLFAVGLLVLFGLAAGAAALAGPVRDALEASAVPDAALVQEDEANQIVMDLAQGSSNQNGGAHLDKGNEDEKENDEGENSTKVAQSIAKFFGVSMDDVKKMHDDGLGYGEIVRAYTLAKSTGKSVTDIIALEKSGKGWGEIERSLNVTPGKLSSTLGTIMRENKRNKDNHGEQKVEKDKNANPNATPPTRGKSQGIGKDKK